MLVHHAEAKRVGIRRAGDGDLLAVHQEAALVRAVIAHQAFHQCGLAGPVLAEQAVHGAGAHPHVDAGQGGKRAEAFADAHGFHPGRGHGRASRNALELATAPNTPPCMATMARAAW